MRKSYDDLYYLIIFIFLSFIILLWDDLAMPVGKLALTGCCTGYVAALIFYNIHNQAAYIIKKRKKLFSGKDRKKGQFKLPAFQFRMIPDLNRKTVRRRSGFGSSKRKRHSSASSQTPNLQTPDATSQLPTSGEK